MIGRIASNKKTSGYLVTYNNDTVPCIFKLGINQYRTLKDSTYNKLLANEVKAYHLNKRNLTYRAKAMPGMITPIFMQLADSGKIDLYTYTERIGKAIYNYRFAQKNGQPIVEIYGGKTEDTKAALITLIDDNPMSIADLNRSKSYRLKLIDSAIRLYNTSIVH